MIDGKKPTKKNMERFNKAIDSYAFEISPDLYDLISNDCPFLTEIKEDEQEDGMPEETDEKQQEDKPEKDESAKLPHNYTNDFDNHAKKVIKHSVKPAETNEKQSEKEEKEEESGYNEIEAVRECKRKMHILCPRCSSKKNCPTFQHVNEEGTGKIWGLKLNEVFFGTKSDLVNNVAIGCSVLYFKEIQEEEIQEEEIQEDISEKIAQLKQETTTDLKKLFSKNDDCNITPSDLLDNKKLILSAYLLDENEDGDALTADFGVREIELFLQSQDDFKHFKKFFQNGIQTLVESYSHQAREKAKAYLDVQIDRTNKSRQHIFDLIDKENISEINTLFLSFLISTDFFEDCDEFQFHDIMVNFISKMEKLNQDENECDAIECTGHLHFGNCNNCPLKELKDEFYNVKAEIFGDAITKEDPEIADEHESAETVNPVNDTSETPLEDETSTEEEPKPSDDKKGEKKSSDE